MSPFWIYLELRMMECQITSSTHQHHNNITRNVLCACNTCRASHGFKSIFLEFAANSQLTPPPSARWELQQEWKHGWPRTTWKDTVTRDVHGNQRARRRFPSRLLSRAEIISCCLWRHVRFLFFFQTIPGFTAARDDGSNSSDNQNSYSASTANPLVVIHAR